jgi:magnesium-transporting ATPase (P-type)
LVIDELVPVIRGKFGATQSVSIWNLVVGDVILLDTGAKIPADCIVVESSDLMVQEPTGKKSAFDDLEVIAPTIQKGSS